MGTTEENTVEELSTVEFKQLKGFSCLMLIPFSTIPRDENPMQWWIEMYFGVKAPLYDFFFSRKR
jgi:hypothetical protein